MSLLDPAADSVPQVDTSIPTSPSQDRQNPTRPLMTEIMTCAAGLPLFAGKDATLRRHGGTPRLRHGQAIMVV